MGNTAHDITQSVNLMVPGVSQTREFESLFRSMDLEVLWCEPMSRHRPFALEDPLPVWFGLPTKSPCSRFWGTCIDMDSPTSILGAGSNLLAPDDPWQAAAVQLTGSCSAISLHGNRRGGVRVHAGAGVMLSRLLRFCLKHRFGGDRVAGGDTGDRRGIAGHECWDPTGVYRRFPCMGGCPGERRPAPSAWKKRAPDGLSLTGVATRCGGPGGLSRPLAPCR